MSLAYMSPNEPNTQPAPASIEDTADARSNRLRVLGRKTFVFGSIGHILIGFLHTFVQLTDMAATDIRSDLEAIGSVENVGASAWELWQGLGLLMGFFMIALGLSNLAGLRGRIDDYPAAGVCAVNVAMFVAIGVIGVLYLGPMQMFGGPLGIVLFGLPLIANRSR